MAPALTAPDLDFSEGLGHQHDGVEADDEEDEGVEDQGVSHVPEHFLQALKEEAEFFPQPIVPLPVSPLAPAACKGARRSSQCVGGGLGPPASSRAGVQFSLTPACSLPSAHGGASVLALCWYWGHRPDSFPGRCQPVWGSGSA